MQVNVDDTSSDWAPVVVADSSGSAWVFWMGVDPAQGDYEIYYSHWTGISWTPEERVHADNSQKDAWPTACIGRDGIPWVAWERARLGPAPEWDLLASRWAGIGIGWSVPDTLYAGGAEGKGATLAAGDSALAWAGMIGWVRREGTTYDADIFFRKCEEGTWLPLEQIDRPGIDDLYPDLALSPSGVPWVVWGGGTVLCTCRDEMGWREPTYSHRGSGARMCFSGGVPWVIFGMGGVPYASFWDGQFWWDTGPIPGPYASEDEFDYRPVVAGLSEGGPIVVWPRGDHANAWRGDVYWSLWEDCWWKPEQLVTEPDSEFVAVDEWPEVAVGAGGRTWVVWERYSSPGGGDSEIWARYSDDAARREAWVKSFNATAEGAFVRVEWECEGAVGFNVYRSDAGVCAGASEDGARELLTPAPIAGVSQYLDSTAAPGKRYRYWLEVVSSRGVCEEAGPVLVKLCEGAVRLGVARVRPNPSGTGFLLGYYAGAHKEVAVDVSDVTGRIVRRIAGLQGEGEVTWDGADNRGEEVRPGVYFVRLLLDGKAEGGVEKVLLLR